jgi:hypothetical protein
MDSAALFEKIPSQSSARLLGVGRRSQLTILHCAGPIKDIQGTMIVGDDDQNVRTLEDGGIPNKEL